MNLNDTELEMLVGAITATAKLLEHFNGNEDIVMHQLSYVYGSTDEGDQKFLIRTAQAMIKYKHGDKNIVIDKGAVA